MAHGGKRTGAGRKPGISAKKTEEFREIARKHAGDAIKVLYEVMTTSESDPARVSAANALLDRAYGKPAQAVTGEGGEGPVRLEFSWATAAQSSGS